MQKWKRFNTHYSEAVPAETADEKLDHTPLTFGKYKGKTPSDVAEKDPSYITWMYENVKNKNTCSARLYKACANEDDDLEQDSDFDDLAF